jgi:hypothetical protein
MAGFGLAAIALLAGQFFIPLLGEHLDNTAMIENSGYLRLGMLLLAVILLSIATPVYRPIDWRPEDDAKIEEEHQSFQRKIHR